MTYLTSRLKDKIIIEKPIYTSDEIGGSSVSWEKYTDIYADIEVAGSVKLAYGRHKLWKEMKLVLRNDAVGKGITYDMRIIYDDTVFYIESIAVGDEITITTLEDFGG